MRNTENVTCMCVPDVNKQNGGSGDTSKVKNSPDYWVN